MDRRESEASSGSKGKEAVGWWFTRLKDWAVTSEPSTHALKQHKKHVFKTEGESRDDPEASAKLNVPPNTIPNDAIKPGGLGPDPEDLARKRAQEKRQSRSVYSSPTYSVRSQSVSSSAVSARRAVEGRLPPRTPESSNYSV